jgi:hypothetical protein
MKEEIKYIHDKIIKETFSRPEIAKAYFRKFLPKTLNNVIDIESMLIVNST